MADEKKQPDVDESVLPDVREQIADVEEDETAALPPESEAPDLYAPPAP